MHHSPTRRGWRTWRSPSQNGKAESWLWALRALPPAPGRQCLPNASSASLVTSSSLPEIPIPPALLRVPISPHHNQYLILSEFQSFAIKQGMKAYLIILIMHTGFNSRHCTPLCTVGSHLQVILEQSWWWLDGGIFRGGGGQCLRISLPSSVRKRSYQTLTDGTPRQRQQVVTFCAFCRYSYPNKVTQRKLGWRCFPRVAQKNSPFSKQSPVVAARLLARQNLSPFLETWIPEMVAEGRESVLQAKYLQMDSSQIHHRLLGHLKRNTTFHSLIHLI